MDVVIDTREKHAYSFAGKSDITLHFKKLDTGDYSLVGLEKVVAIERKASTSEMALNLGSGWKRFERELERMRAYKYRILICEFSEEDLLKFPKGAPIPKYLKRKIRVRGKFLVSKLKKIVEEYDLELMMNDDRFEAEDNLYRRLQEIYNEAGIF